MLEEWLQNHPTPSWKLVAWALYRNWGGRLTEHHVLKQLYWKHVSGCVLMIINPQCMRRRIAVVIVSIRVSVTMKSAAYLLYIEKEIS